MRNIKKQTGSMLIEALVSILLFAIGILALMGLQASAVNSTTQSKIRADAAHLANQMIARMRADDSSAAGFNAKYQGSGHGASGVGTEFIAWRKSVYDRLPGSSNTACSSSVTFGSGANSGVVAVRVEWQTPRTDKIQQEGCHNVVVVTQLR